MTFQSDGHCKKIDINQLVNDNVKDKLEFYQNNSSFCESDLIWQQMTCENFDKFLENNALCFKQLSQYKKSDERKLSFYKDCYIHDGVNEHKKKLIKNRNSNFEKIAYISCWFHLGFLTDLAFNEYAQNGVAIGLEIKDLINAIELNSSDLATYEEIYYGKIAYLTGGCKRVTDCEEAIAPLYLKDTSKLSDNEFRLVYIKDSLWVSSVRGMKLPNKIDKLCFINIGDAKKLIKYIAIKEESRYFKNIIRSHNINIRKVSGKMDGFLVYEIKN